MTPRHLYVCAATALIFVALPAYAIIGFDSQTNIDRIKDLQQQWQDHEAAQERIHTEADQERATLCENGVKEYCPEKSRTMEICEAIAWQETKDCTLGAGKNYNNCVGIRRNDAYVVYEKPEDSLNDCVDVWDRLYKTEPTIELARKWSSPGAADNWLKNVLWHLRKNT